MAIIYILKRKLKSHISPLNLLSARGQKEEVSRLQISQIGIDESNTENRLILKKKKVNGEREQKGGT